MGDWKIGREEKLRRRINVMYTNVYGMYYVYVMYIEKNQIQRLEVVYETLFSLIIS